jgi:hypothetical protein
MVGPSLVPLLLPLVSDSCYRFDSGTAGPEILAVVGLHYNPALWRGGYIPLPQPEVATPSNGKNIPMSEFIAGNILIVTFSLADLLLVSLYQGLLLTELLHPPNIKPFSGVDEMINRIANKEFSLITYYTGYWQVLLDRAGGVIKRVTTMF